jgi:hypothetical protein
MAIYYVRPDGSNTNAGTGPGAGQAWATVAFALGAASGTNPGLVGGDTVYIAPGTYRNVVTIGYTTPTSMITVQGDPSCSQFSGLTAGPIRITNAPVGDTAPTRGQFFTGTTDYLTLRNIQFDGLSAYSTGLVTLTGGNLTIDKCCFQTYTDTNNGFGTVITIPSSKNNITISNCIYFVYQTGITINLATQGSSNYNTNTQINNCFIYSQTGSGLTWSNTTAGQFSGLSVKDSTIIGGNNGLSSGNLNQGTGNTVLNSILNGVGARGINQWNSGSMTATNCSIIGASSISNVTQVNCNTSMQLYDLGQSRLWGIGQVETFSPQQGSVMLNAGTTGGIATDLMGVTWLTPSTPTLGTLERSSTSTVGFYIPAERNASTITIAPASTSQSIELYLGVTGLTFATSGLAAYYVRNQSAPVAITLVTQTPTGAWTSGGFAEISSTFTPGVYRLDVPDAAFAAGASDVTIVVRGASGTNGAVLTVTLSSGGLTAAQTAAAVWDASRSAYATAGTFGEYVNVNVNSGAIADAVWDEARSGHTTVGTFGQYVNAELVTPVTSAALVRMGPFEVRADGLGASDPLDIQKGAQHGIDVQCVDNNGAGIDITSATVTAKVYNSGATLVDTYACTATYAADGRATFTIDTTVTNVPGTYTATITRTTGASDTQVFGPLRIYVRDI